MIKKIFYPILFLLLFGALLSFLGRNSDYAAERKLVSANKLFLKSARTPETIPPRLYEKIKKSYEKIIARYDGTKSEKEARLLLSRLYMFMKDYAAARAELNKIIEKYPDNESYCAEAVFTSGNSYEAENKWDKALAEYERIMRDYTPVARALDMPIYIAGHYAKNNDKKSADAYLWKALGYYKKIYENNPNSQAAYVAMGLEVTVFELLGEWQNTLTSIQQIINAYPYAPTLINSLRAIEMIAVSRLKDPEAAIKIFTDFIEKYPEHKIKPIILKEIENIKTKSQNNDADKPKS